MRKSISFKMAEDIGARIEGEGGWGEKPLQPINLSRIDVSEFRDLGLGDEGEVGEGSLEMIRPGEVIDEAVETVKDALKTKKATVGQLKSMVPLMAQVFLQEGGNSSSWSEPKSSEEFVPWVLMAAAGIGLALALWKKDEIGQFMNKLSQRGAIKELKRAGLEEIAGGPAGRVEIQEPAGVETKEEKARKKKEKRKKRVKAIKKATRQAMILITIAGSVGGAFWLGVDKVMGMIDVWNEVNPVREQAVEEGLISGIPGVDEISPQATGEMIQKSLEMRKMLAYYDDYSEPSTWGGEMAWGVNKSEPLLKLENIDDEKTQQFSAWKGASWIFGVYTEGYLSEPNPLLVDYWSEQWQLSAIERFDLENSWLEFSRDRKAAYGYLEELNIKNRLGDKGEEIIKFYSEANRLFEVYPGEAGWEQRWQALKAWVEQQKQTEPTPTAEASTGETVSLSRMLALAGLAHMGGTRRDFLNGLTLLVGAAALGPLGKTQIKADEEEI